MGGHEARGAAGNSTTELKIAMTRPAGVAGLHPGLVSSKAAPEVDGSFAPTLLAPMHGRPAHVFLADDIVARATPVIQAGAVEYRDVAALVGDEPRLHDSWHESDGLCASQLAAPAEVTQDTARQRALGDCRQFVGEKLVVVSGAALTRQIARKLPGATISCLPGV